MRSLRCTVSFWCCSRQSHRNAQKSWISSNLFAIISPLWLWRGRPDSQTNNEAAFAIRSGSHERWGFDARLTSARANWSGARLPFSTVVFWPPACPFHIVRHASQCPPRNSHRFIANSQRISSGSPVSMQRMRPSFLSPLSTPLTLSRVARSTQTVPMHDSRLLRSFYQRISAQTAHGITYSFAKFYLRWYNCDHLYYSHLEYLSFIITFY